MNFFCNHEAYFTKNISLPNIIGDVSFNQINTNTIRCKDILANNVIVNHINIYDKIMDICNNVEIIIDEVLDANSVNKLSNREITYQLSLKNDIIYDLSGFLIAGENINLINHTIQKSINKAYFMIYFSGSFANTFGGPRRMPLGSIKLQNPSTGTIISDGYVIQVSGIYKLRFQMRIGNNVVLTKTGIAITRGSSTIYPKIGGNTLVTSNDNTILYPCEIGDQISIMTVEPVAFQQFTAYYGSLGSGNNPTPTGAMNSFLYGIKIS
jgi:hypothetical protein